MNREIKFKAWVFSMKKMFHWGSDLIRIHHNLSWDSLTEGCFDGNDSILLQSTELKDCNNIDIFEGDILQVKLPLGGFWGDVKTEKIGVVEYNNDKCAYVVRWEYSRNQNYIQLDCDLEVKVIGNIYENKELLKW